MLENIKNQVHYCLEMLSEGRLDSDHLNSILRTIKNYRYRQRLLFLRVEGWTVNSPVVGLMLLEDNEISEGPVNPEDWPYNTVIDAIEEGWRVIKFPELALHVDERQTYEVGGEFVLEKWGTV